MFHGIDFATFYVFEYTFPLASTACTTGSTSSASSASTFMLRPRFEARYTTASQHSAQYQVLYQVPVYLYSTRYILHNHILI